MKTKLINVRIEPAVLELLENKAKENSISISAYIRNMASIEIAADLISQRMVNRLKDLKRMEKKNDVEIVEFADKHLSFFKYLISSISNQIKTLTVLEKNLLKDYENISDVLKNNFEKAVEAMEKERCINEGKNKKEN
ncbi:MAG TPA: hypothetical protein PLU55_05025 [Candidatus Pacearchaeota archaeon]|nr:hypothetical protein [Candidatus Pacearchaeota archaeon]